VQSLGGQNVALNQRIKRLQRRRAGADQVGERRKAQRRRRHPAGRLQTLKHDLELLILRSAAPPASLHYFKPAGLRTVRMAVHKDSSQHYVSPDTAPFRGGIRKSNRIRTLATKSIAVRSSIRSRDLERPPILCIKRSAVDLALSCAPTILALYPENAMLHSSRVLL